MHIFVQIGKHNGKGGFRVKCYKVTCDRGYSILNEAPPKLDKQALYVIIEKSIYYENCVLVKRTDEKKYLGNDTWIVPETEVKLVDI